MVPSEPCAGAEINLSLALAQGAPEPNPTPQPPQLTEATESNAPSHVPNGHTGEFSMSDNPPTKTNSWKGISADLQGGKYEIPIGPNGPDHTSPDDQLLHLYPTMTPYQQLKYRTEYNFVPMVPSQTSNAKIVMLQNIRQMAILGATIEDDQRRAEFLDRTFEKYKEIWFEALRLGYDAGLGSEEDQKTRGRMVKTRKKEVPPSAKPVFSPEKFKDIRGKCYNITPITAGEFEEAGITTEQVQATMEQKNEEINSFLQRVHDFVGRDVQVQDWDRVRKATNLNPTGRDLFFYSVYTAQFYSLSLKQLHKYQSTFRTTAQAKNGRKRIANEQASQNFLLAIALEINQGKSYLHDANESRDEAALVELGYGIVSHEVTSPASPREMVDMASKETEPNDLVQAFNMPAGSTVNLDPSFPAHSGTTPADKAEKDLALILDQTLHVSKQTDGPQSSSNEAAVNDEERRVELVERELCEKKTHLEAFDPASSQDLRQKQPPQPDTEREAAREEDEEEETLTPHSVPSATSNVDNDKQSDTTANLTSPPNKRSAQDGNTEPLLASPSKRHKGTVAASTIPNQHEPNSASEDTSSLETCTRSEDASDPSSPPTSGETSLPWEAKSNLSSWEARPQLPTETLMMEPLSEKHQYVKQVLTPMANDLLLAQDHLPLHPLTQWSQIKKTMIKAGVPVLDRNQVIRRYNAGIFQGWKVSVLVQEQEPEPEPEPVQELVQEEKKQKELAVHPSLVTLAVKRKFDPERLSHYHVHVCNGFRFRFTEDSTIVERMATDANGLVDLYIQDRIDHPEKYGRPRYGSYEGVSSPEDPTRKCIVHGVWDDMDGNPLLQDFSWFYYPKESPTRTNHDENTTTPENVDSSDDTDTQSDSVVTGRRSPDKQKKKKTVKFAPEPDADLSHDEEGKPTIRLRLPAHKRNAKEAGPKLLKTRHSPSLMAPKTGLKHSKPRQAIRKAVATPGRVTKANKTKPKVPQRGRPKRNAATTRKEYLVPDPYENDSGDEWTPGDSE